MKFMAEEAGYDDLGDVRSVGASAADHDYHLSRILSDGREWSMGGCFVGRNWGRERKFNDGRMERGGDSFNWKHRKFAGLRIEIRIQDGDV